MDECGRESPRRRGREGEERLVVLRYQGRKMIQRASLPSSTSTSMCPWDHYGLDGEQKERYRTFRFVSTTVFLCYKAVLRRLFHAPVQLIWIRPKSGLARSLKAAGDRSRSRRPQPGHESTTLTFVDLPLTIVRMSMEGIWRIDH